MWHLLLSVNVPPDRGPGYPPACLWTQAACAVRALETEDRTVLLGRMSWGKSVFYFKFVDFSLK